MSQETTVAFTAKTWKLMRAFSRITVAYNAAPSFGMGSTKQAKRRASSAIKTWKALPRCMIWQIINQVPRKSDKSPRREQWLTEHIRVPENPESGSLNLPLQFVKGKRTTGPFWKIYFFGLGSMSPIKKTWQVKQAAHSSLVFAHRHY